MLLEVKNLKKYYCTYHGRFSREKGCVKAVDDISLCISENEVLGLVGESGCGKSTVGKSILRLIEPTNGCIHFNAIDFIRLKGKAFKAMRKNMQIIFQDSLSSLDPRMTIGSILLEPFQIHKIGTREEQKKEILNLLDMVGLSSNTINRYPHEFSGGQCQRIGIARAIALRPKLIVADEPVSALDVSIQAQIVNLMIDLKKQLGLSYLFISHDLSVVRYISDRIAVMYFGKIVESGSAKEVCDSPLHPYTKALLSVVPSPNLKKTRKKTILKGDMPSSTNPPSGCLFHTRCPCIKDGCKHEIPKFEEKKPGRFVRCTYV